MGVPGVGVEEPARIAGDHLGLLKTIFRHFPEGDGFSADAEKAEARLASRATSCCPGPVKLAKLRKSIPAATS